MSLEVISNMFGWSSIAGRAVSEWFHYRLLVYITTKRKGRPHGTHAMCEWLNALTHPEKTERRVKFSCLSNWSSSKQSRLFMWFSEK